MKTGWDVKTRTGSISMIEDGQMLVVRPRGYIGRRMLHDSFAHALKFALAHPDGWWHVTDASGFAVPNPLNTMELRRIMQLPNIHGYVLMTPNAALATAMRIAWRPVIGATHVVRSLDDVRLLISRS